MITIKCTTQAEKEIIDNVLNHSTVKPKEPINFVVDDDKEITIGLNEFLKKSADAICDCIDDRPLLVTMISNLAYVNARLAYLLFDEKEENK